MQLTLYVTLLKLVQRGENVVSGNEVVCASDGTGCALSRPEAAHTCLVFERPSLSMCLDNICVSRAKGVRFNQSYYSILHINKFKHFLVHMNRTTSDLLFIFVLSRIG